MTVPSVRSSMVDGAMVAPPTVDVLVRRAHVPAPSVDWAEAISGNIIRAMAARIRVLALIIDLVLFIGSTCRIGRFNAAVHRYSGDEACLFARSAVLSSLSTSVCCGFAAL